MELLHFRRSCTQICLEKQNRHGKPKKRLLNSANSDAFFVRSEQKDTSRCPGPSKVLILSTKIHHTFCRTLDGSCTISEPRTTAQLILGYVLLIPFRGKVEKIGRP